MAKPQKIKEGSTKPVWSEDSWLQEHAGKTLNNEPENFESGDEDDKNNHVNKEDNDDTVKKKKDNDITESTPKKLKKV